MIRLKQTFAITTVLLFVTTALLHAADQPQATSPPPVPSEKSTIYIELREDDNIRIVNSASPTRVVAELNPSIHYFFAGTFHNLPINQETTIGIDLSAGNKASANANVAKWVGLHPLVTYADPSRYESYEWFTRDANGKWISGDPFKRGAAKFAGNGKVPVQYVIPAQLSAEFLSADGNYWQPWHELTETASITTANLFQIKYAFKLPVATIAMRVPFSCLYEQALIKHIQELHDQDIAVDDLGETEQHHRIQIIRVGAHTNKVSVQVNPESYTLDGDRIPAIHITKGNDEKTNALLIVAREHGSEPDGSWALLGMIDYLLAHKEALSKTLWCIIPLLDPDACANAQYVGAVESGFRYQQPANPYADRTYPYAVYAYANYCCSMVNAGIGLPLSATFCNIECNENSNSIFTPVALRGNMPEVTKFNDIYFTLLKNSGFLTDSVTPKEELRMPFRIFGYCAKYYGTVALTFEINNRCPAKPLSLQENEAVGAKFVEAISVFQTTDTYTTLEQRMYTKLDTRMKNRSAVYQRAHWPVGELDLDYIINKGF